MIPLYAIIVILFAHWISDFVLQSTWMAKNKSIDNNALLSHVAVYTFGMFLAALWLMPLADAIAFSIITFGTHFLVDHVTSRITRRLWEKQDVHNFFVVIGLDQMIHYITLFGTYLTVVNA